MAFLTTMLQNLVSMEFFQLLFPFLLALAIIYGILYSTAKERLGKGPIGLISIVLSFFVMLYSSWNTWLFQWLTGISGVWLAVASAILFLVILLELAGLSISKITEWKASQIAIALVIVFIVVVLIFGATPFGMPWGSFVFTSDLWTIVFFIIVLAIVMWFLTREKAPGGGQQAAPPGARPG